MHTVLNSRMMDAVMALRKTGKFSFACQVIVNGKRQAGLLGPRIEGYPNDVWVLVDGKRRVLPLGQISVEGAVLEALQVVMDAQAEALAEQEAYQMAMSDQALLNDLLWRSHQARRNPSGRFVGHHVEKAGRR